VIKAKKSLGQNFLIDQNIIDTIVNTIEIKDKNILEVGPGTGSLTSSILKKKPKKLIVFEKDNNLVSLLRKKFQNEIEIINEDILKFNVSSLSKEKFIVFGNLPYNISTEILSKWILNLDNNNIWFSNLILMFQREVAERIISNYNCSKYGRLSILANWRLKVKKIIDIKPNSFFPKPKIESTLLQFSHKKSFIKFKDPYNLERITRVFFNQRRKMIKKPYKQIFSIDTNISEKLKINLNLRPQNLDFETYYKLTSEYENSRA
tara:strand:+ start:277 stop:1065 length:789 start_codon:yes stop_codon:yes gene_type:complete